MNAETLVRSVLSILNKNTSYDEFAKNMYVLGSPYESRKHHVDAVKIIEKNQRSFVAMPRQSGKTVLIMMSAMKFALQNPNKSVTIITQSHYAQQHMIRMILDTLTSIKMINYMNSSAVTFKLLNGATIDIIPSSSHMRGYAWSHGDLILVDEPADKHFKQLIENTFSSPAKIAIITTPAHDLLRYLPASFTTTKMVCSDCFSEKECKQLQVMIDQKLFDKYYNCSEMP